MEGGSKYYPGYACIGVGIDKHIVESSDHFVYFERDFYKIE